MRITGGELGGRVLSVPKGGAVRPTQERVREAVFSSLGEAILDAEVADLFAGTGALGIEAWSRGAARVVWVEQDPRAYRLLKDNVRKLCGDEAAQHCVQADVFTYLKRGGVPFDFVLADPPYDRHTQRFETDRFLDLLSKGGHMKLGGWLVLEQRASQPVAEHADWTLRKNKTYGDTRVCFYSYVE